jgi:NarL family two-component system response regulator YdfI
LIRVVIIASSIALRVGLRALLQSGPDIQVNGEAASLAELDALTSETDVLLVAGETSWSAIEVHPPAQREERCGLVVLSDQAQRAAELVAAWNSPAWGVLSSDATSDELAAAIWAVSQGLLAGSPRLLNQVLHQPERIVRQVGEIFDELTERERQVLQYLAQGLANKQIGLALGISEHTVKFHVSAIYNKLGASNRTEAARLGLQQGLISL